MTLHAIKTDATVALSNSDVFNCSREELSNILEKYDFGQAMNYRLTVAIPPERQKSKNGIYFPEDLSATEQFKTSIGRVISRGSTVGDNPSLKDCKDIVIGDYVRFAYHAAGLPEMVNDVMVKYLVDDQVIIKVNNPDTIARLYDY